VDGCTFWYTTEYLAATSSIGWSTWIGSFTFPGCGTPATPPSAPTGLTASATTGTSDQVDLAWTGSAGATSYDVFRGGAKIGSTTGTTYHDSGLTPSTQYSYWVVAVNAAGSSGPSNTATVTTNAAAAQSPGAFTLSGSALSSTSVRLTWTASSRATSYQVYRHQGPKGAYGLVSGCSTTTTSCTDSGLTPATSYSYYVVAANSSGTATSNTVSVRTAKR
jgi:fibronectin type 3 domain-containing protein